MNAKGQGPAWDNSLFEDNAEFAYGFFHAQDSIRKELLLPLLCGIFLVESLSVMLQVSYFKYTKRKYGEGRRILLMSPLHHHYQKQGFFETKIVTRFWIVSLLLAAITLVTLKIR